MSAAPIWFGIVGSGWRAEFFARLARALPERLAVAGVVTRSAERAAQVEAEWGVPAFRTVGELCGSKVEFVIPSVPSVNGTRSSPAIQERSLITRM